jgi:hypothetical protein
VAAVEVDEVGDLAQERRRLRLQFGAAGVEEDAVGEQPDDQAAGVDRGLDRAGEAVAAGVGVEALLQPAELVLFGAEGGGGAAAAATATAWVEKDEPPGTIEPLPPSSFGLKAWESASRSVWNFETFTAEIAKRTMKRASSRVIMSA